VVLTAVVARGGWGNWFAGTHAPESQSNPPSLPIGLPPVPVLPPLASAFDAPPEPPVAELLLPPLLVLIALVTLRPPAALVVAAAGPPFEDSSDPQAMAKIAHPATHRSVHFIVPPTRR
jgi:hypothetical protein